MTPDSPLGYLLVTSALALSAMGIVRSSDYFAKLVAPDGAARFRALDGLRGFLACGVFVHHAAVTYALYRTGTWDVPRSRLYAFLGGDGVNVFFIVTGFLFWSKALSRGGSIDALQLLRSRIRRIMPMYLTALAVILIVVLFVSGFRLYEPALTVLGEIALWSLGGVAGSPTINGQATLFINCGVTWTLAYEWGFYFALPVIAVFATPRRFPVLCALFIAAALGLQLSHLAVPFSMGSIGRFFMGMTVAHLVKWRSEIPQLRSPVLSVLLAVALAATVALPVPRVVVGLVLWLGFAAVIYGNSCFGLFTNRWASLLGHVSYSIYLIHGVLLTTSLRLLDVVTPVGALSPLSFWGFCCVIALLVVGVSAATYRFVEAPFIRSA
jgi:peptidoglycan/LPS O-acetylase OafA/YrhL